VAIDASKLRHGRVRGRYFRENSAQAGIDLSQIIPELVTNADAAIDAAGRERGRIQLRIGPADPEFLQAWKTALRSLRLPVLRAWRYELVCSDDGEGVDAEVVDERLGARLRCPRRSRRRSRACRAGVVRA
jgi:two-component sensor histidine kinase